MNPQELQAIRDRAAGALPGPWGWFGNTRTHLVYLATKHSGRLFLLMPTIEKTYRVRHRDDDEGCSIAAAAEFVEDQLEGWFPVEDMHCPDCSASPLEGEAHTEACPKRADWRPPEHPLRARAKKWIEDLQRNPEYVCDFYDDDFRVVIELHTSHDAILQFQRRDAAGKPDHLLESYKDIARYEVLDGRTRAQHEAGGHEGSLYREDIVGLANPDAEFIAHSRSDIDALLGEIDRLNDALRILAATCDGTSGEVEVDDLFERGLLRCEGLRNPIDTEITGHGRGYVREVLLETSRKREAVSA